MLISRRLDESFTSRLLEVGRVDKCEDEGQAILQPRAAVRLASQESWLLGAAASKS